MSGVRSAAAAVRRRTRATLAATSQCASHPSPALIRAGGGSGNAHHMGTVGARVWRHPSVQCAHGCRHPTPSALLGGGGARSRCEDFGERVFYYVCLFCRYLGNQWTFFAGDTVLHAWGQFQRSTLKGLRCCCQISW